MALDISGLQAYVQDPSILIGQLVNRDTILRLFESHEGFQPGEAVLRLYNAGGDLRDCCEIPDGTGAFAQTLIDVSCILSGNEFCLEDLARVIRDSKMRFTSGKESAGSVEQLIMDQELAEIARKMDILVFQGDITSQDENKNKFDGLIKQAAEISAPVAISTGNVYQALQRIISSINVDAYDMGNVAVLVGIEVAQALQSALIALNMYNFNPGDRKFNDFISFPGFAGISIVPTRGLNHTNTVIVTPFTNIHWLTNLEDDHMEMTWDYDKYRQRYYWRVKFILGVGFGIYDFVQSYTLSNSVITAPVGIPVQSIA